jgi:hypothetical protein
MSYYVEVSLSSVEIGAQIERMLEDSWPANRGQRLKSFLQTHVHNCCSLSPSRNDAVGISAPEPGNPLARWERGIHAASA